LSVCVCVRARACVRACVRVRVCFTVFVRAPPERRDVMPRWPEDKHSFEPDVASHIRFPVFASVTVPKLREDTPVGVKFL
jgi:hypothetical protein